MPAARAPSPVESAPPQRPNGPRLVEVELIYNYAPMQMMEYVSPSGEGGDEELVPVMDKRGRPVPQPEITMKLAAGERPKLPQDEATRVLQRGIARITQNSFA